jgi:hypothetical protein
VFKGLNSMNVLRLARCKVGLLGRVMNAFVCLTAVFCAVIGSNLSAGSCVQCVKAGGGRHEETEH